MIRHPGMTTVEMGFHSQRCPILKFLLDVCACTLRLKSERVSAEVDRGAAVRPEWNTELLPEQGQWIARIHLCGKAGGCVESDRSHLHSWQRSQLLLHQCFGLRPIDVLEPLHRIAKLAKHAVLHGSP